MSNSAILSLDSLPELVPSEVLPLAKQLFEVNKMGFEIAPTFLIPNSTTHAILHKDTSVQNSVMHFYHEQCKNDFVTIYFSINQNNQLLSTANIKGEANFLESLFEIANLHPDYSLVLQATPLATHSGIIWSKNIQTSDNRQVEIWYANGSVPNSESFEHNRLVIHIHDHATVITKKLTTEKTWIRINDTFKQIPSSQKYPQLSKNKIEELVKIITLCKQHFFVDQKITWSIFDKRIIIHTIESISNEMQEDMDFEEVAIGTTLIPGYVQGEATFATHNNQTHSNQILVAQSLSKKDLPLLKKVSGIIVEKNIKDPQVLALITTFNIPTILHTHFILKQSFLNHQLILDSTHGKVFVQKITHETKKRKNQTNYSLLTSYPSQLIEKQLSLADKLIVTSNSWFVSLKNHPLQLTKEEKKSFLSLLFDELISAEKSCPQKWMYFFSSLDSTQRKKLHYGESLEDLEINPAFGNRGTTFLIKNTQLLDLELEGLLFVLEKIKSTDTHFQMELIFPFVKTVEDAVFFDKIITQKFPKLAMNSKKWIHIYSLNGLQTILETKYWQPSGIIIDLDYLLCSWHGDDPQPTTSKIFQNYQNSSFWNYLDQLLENSNLPYKIICRRLTHSTFPITSNLKNAEIITKIGYLATSITS